MRTSLIVFFCLWIIIPSIAQEDDGFSAFLTEFKTAIKNKDKNKVAEMTTFPMNSFDFAAYAGLPTGSNELDKESFLKGYKNIFTAKRVKTMLQKDPVKTDLYGEEEVTYTLIYASDITFTCWLVFAKNENGEWKFVFTDNVSYGE